MEGLEDRTNPTQTVNLVVLTSSIAENDPATAILELTRSDTAGTLSVSGTFGGTAGGLDYTASPLTAYFPDGIGTITFTATPTPDSLVEGTETITYTISPGSYTINNGFASVNLTDSTSPPPPPQTVHIESSGSVTEGGSPNATAFRVVRSSSSGSLSVNLDFKNSTASSMDYTANSLFAYFMTGETEKFITITPNDDSTIEGTEIIAIDLVADPMYAFAIGSPASASINIHDNDFPQVTVAKLADAAENGGAGTFQISRTGPLTSSLDVTFSITGGALEGMDFPNIGTTVTIPANSATVDITVTAFPDNIVEGNETVTIAVADGTPAYTASNATASLNITDDPPVISVNVANTTEGSSAYGYVRFIRTGGKMSQDLPLTYTIGGTATNGTDYASLPGSAIIPAGLSSVDVYVVALADNIVEASNETVTMEIVPSLSYVLAGAAVSMTGVVTIIDDAPVVSVEWVADAEEGGADGKFQFLRSGGKLTEALTVDYEIAGGATSILDYAAIDDTITFPAGVAKIDLQVAPADDTIAEGDETVTVELLPGACNSVGMPSDATVKIIDNDQGNGPPFGTGTGLFGRYYNGENFEVIKKARIDADIDFDWQSGGPAFGVASDSFTIRWQGKVQPRYTGEYTFFLTADDGVRMWVNGVQLVGNEQWDAAPGTRSGTISLQAGEKYVIHIDYREKAGLAYARLEWQHAMQPREVIPQTQLYPQVATIGNFVWKDLDRDGVQDAGEPGVEGVAVSIEHDNGSIAVPPIVTGANGEYSFVVPADMAYKLRFSPGATGDVFAPQDATADSADSDVDSSGLTSLFVAPGADGVDNTRDAGLQPIRFDLDVNANGSLGDPMDGAKKYLPGYLSGVPVLSSGKTYRDQVYNGQAMKLILEGVGTSNAAITKVDFEIFEVTKYDGYASNKSSPAVEGTDKDDDYSFSLATDSAFLSLSRAQMGADKTMVDFFAKDYGGGANVSVKVYVQDGAGSKLSASYALNVPLDTDADAISNFWQDSMAAKWRAQYGSAWTPWKEQDLERMDPDGPGPLVEQKAIGDAHHVREEYRGYILDGGGFDGAGANGHSGGHIRLDPARKEVLLEVDRAAVLNNLPAGGLEGMLNGASKVLSQGQRGAGIYVYWLIDESALQIPPANINTFDKIVAELEVTRNQKLKSDFIHLLFVDTGVKAGSQRPGNPPAFTVDREYPAVNLGSIYATTELSQDFGATDFPKRDELFACTIAHEVVHQLIDGVSAPGFNEGEHTLDPNTTDLPQFPKDWDCLMYHGTFKDNREFSTVRMYPVVQMLLDVRSAEGLEAL